MDESEPQRSAHIAVTREPSQRCWLYLSVDRGSRKPRTNIYKSRAGRGETRGTARTAALGAGSSQQGLASRPNLGLPAGAPVPPGGSGTQARLGLPERGPRRN